MVSVLEERKHGKKRNNSTAEMEQRVRCKLSVGSSVVVSLQLEDGELRLVKHISCRHPTVTIR